MAYPGGGALRLSGVHYKMFCVSGHVVNQCKCPAPAGEVKLVLTQEGPCRCPGPQPPYNDDLLDEAREVVADDLYEREGE